MAPERKNDSTQYSTPPRRIGSNCCQYCGNGPNCAIAKCLTCNRYFCNAGGFVEGSHLGIHMKISKHRTFQVFAKPGAAGVTPKCAVCGCTNFFDLRILKDSKGNAIEIICLEKCIASMKLSNPVFSNICYSSLFEKEGISKSIIAQIPTNRYCPCKLTFSLIRKIERLWSKNSNLQITDIKIDRPIPLPTMRDFYKNTLEYYTVIEPLLRREEYEQREAALTDGTKHVKVEFGRTVQKRETFAHGSKTRNDSKAVEEVVESVIATFEINLDDYHRKVRRFDDLVLTRSDIQEDGIIEKMIQKKKSNHQHKNDEFEGMVGSRIAKTELDDYNDSADLGQYTLDYDKRVEYTGRIILLNENKISMKVLTNQIPENERKFVTGFYDVRLVDTQAIVNRRLNGIKKLDDDSSVDQYIYNKLMGDKRDSNFDAFKCTRSEICSNGVVEIPGLGTLNHSQMVALETAVRRRLTLIQGPPGTGKTLTAAAIVYTLVMRNRKELRDIPFNKDGPGTLPGRVLVATPSNVAADEICSRIAMTGVKVVRLMASSREMDDSPIDELCVHTIALRCLMESDFSEFKKIHELYENGDSSLTEKEDRLHYTILRKIKMEVIKEAEVIVCTCDTSGSSILDKEIFNSVLIDEVSQTTEPEALIPIVHGAQRVVLVGDHKQLAPVVMSIQVREAGFESSIFERLVKQGETPVLLDIQYRIHPAIAHYPSDAFYDGKLRDGISKTDRCSPELIHYTNPDKPIQFCCVYGQEEISSEGSSYVNLEEALVAMNVVRYLISCGVTADRIGLLTSYTGQRKLLQRNMTKQKLEAVEIASVNTFQGREKDFIIYSCVRSNEYNILGFSADIHRMNVVLTRARYGLFLIGNPKVFCHDANWLKYLDYNLKYNMLVTGTPGKWVIKKNLE